MPRLVLALPFVLSLTATAVPRFEFPAAGSSHYLVVEVLSDTLVHCEVSGYGKSPGAGQPIYVSPMVDRQRFARYSGPTSLRQNGNRIETKALAITIETDGEGDRCVRYDDKANGVYLTRICAKDLARPKNQRLTLDRGEMSNAYGIGNLFVDPKTADGDWIGRMWRGRNNGNFRFGPHWFDEQFAGEDSFHGGGPSVSQFPILYATGRELGTDRFQNYALFVDHVYKMSWYFNEAHRWTAQSYGDHFRWFFFGGNNLRELRRDFLDLVGRPPVPPKSTFGLWISKFGYDSWGEMRRDLDSLRRNRFPFDGVALDLQWFGGRFNEPGAEPRMGKLQFNEAANAFPRPQEEVPALRRQYGIRLMPIEESYIDSRIPEYGLLSRDREHCYLASVTGDRCQPVSLTRDIKNQQNIFVWWGKGGMIDWSNSEGARFWHQTKRMPLAQLGIYSHWLDLGEPEMYYEYAWYHGVDGLNKRAHGDIHNLYNLLWAKSIDDGYRDSGNQTKLAGELSRELGMSFKYGPRHFTMSRAGTVGSQRYGGMWSGDVGRNAGNLRAHLNTQLHMSLAGMDYYGSDAGGFLGTDQGIEAGHNEGELYTKWFANNSLTDVPVRPHAWAIDKNVNVTPDHKGDIESNRFHVRQRYELTPYIYSLAHAAYRSGEPIFPPPVYYFQGDGSLRDKGNLKMIGPSLLMGVIVDFGERVRSVYLPRGTWINYHRPEQWVHSAGESVTPIELAKEGFRIPVFARGGAILPKMYVDDQTLNVSGRRVADEKALSSEEKRRDALLRDQLIVRVYADGSRSRFILTEDDGISLGYEHGEARTVALEQELAGDVATVHVGAARGDYTGAVKRRATLIELVTERGTVTAVSDDAGNVLPSCRGGETELASGAACWVSIGGHLTKARFGARDVGQAQTFRFRVAR